MNARERSPGRQPLARDRRRSRVKRELMALDTVARVYAVYQRRASLGLRVRVALRP